jgi:hypothetical protein
MPTFDEIEAELSLLVDQMVDKPHGRHELWQQIHAKLNEMRAMGMPVPEDFVRLEKELEAEFAEEQGSAEEPT